MDLTGAYLIEAYHSYTGGTVRAVITVVQDGAKICGTYEFERRDNGEVSWGSWPESNGDVFGEQLGELAPKAPNGQPWQWWLSLAGTECYAQPDTDGRIGLSRTADSQWFTEHLAPIQIAPSGEPYRDVARYLQAIVASSKYEDARAAELRRDHIESIRRLLVRHPAIQSRVADLDRLERADIAAVLAATEHEALVEERAHLAALRTSWAPRFAALEPPPPNLPSSPEQKAIAAGLALLASDDASEQRAGAKALCALAAQKINIATATPSVHRGLSREPLDPEARASCAGAMYWQYKHFDQSLPSAWLLLAQSSPDIRLGVATAIWLDRASGETPAVPIAPMLRLLQDPDARVRNVAGLAVEMAWIQGDVDARAYEAAKGAMGRPEGPDVAPVEPPPPDSPFTTIVKAATALTDRLNYTRGDLLVAVRDATNATSIRPDAAVTAALNAVPFASLLTVDSAWRALCAALPYSELRTDQYAPVQPLNQTSIAAVLHAWFAETFQPYDTSEEAAFVAAMNGCTFQGGFEGMTPTTNTAVRFALVTSSTLAILFVYTGDGP